jgi:hypothetical protein
MLGTIRGKQRDALPTDDIATRRHPHLAHCKFGATRQRRRQIGNRSHTAQPIRQGRNDSRIIAADTCQQTVAIARRSLIGAFQQHRDFGTGAIRRPGSNIRTASIHRRQAFAQNGFNRVFPAGFNMNPLPQRLLIRQTVPLQPLANLGAALHALLQLLKRTLAGFGFVLCLLCLLHVLLNLAAAYFKLRQALLRCRHLFLCRQHLFLEGRMFGFLQVDFSLIRLQQRGRFMLQTLTTTANIEQGALGIGLVRLFHAQLLLSIGNCSTLRIHGFLCGNLAFLRQWQTLLLRFQTHLGLLGALVGQFGEFPPPTLVGIGFFSLHLPLLAFGTQLDNTLLQVALRIAAMAQLCLQAGHFGVGGEQIALCRMHTVGRAEMGFTRCLKPRFGFT